MIPFRLLRPYTALCASALVASALLASGWKQYSSSAYGFKMLVPEGTSVKTKEFGGGWGGIYANSEGVELFGIAKLGTQATDSEIEQFAAEKLGIPSKGWKQIDSGSGRGWIRYRTFEAVRGSKLYFGGYGIGPKGTYLLVLETTVEDYNEHKSDYLKWYNSVTLE